MQTFTYKELRSRAQKLKIPGCGFMNKDELCKVLNVVRVEHEPKYVLEDPETGLVTKWRSVNYMGTTLKINPGNIFYALKRGSPLKVDGIPHILTQIRV